MGENTFVLDDVKRRLKVEQAVREFFHVLESQQMDLQEGLVAWNMFGFTIFQDMYPDQPHEFVHKKMIEFSENLFNSSKKPQ